MLNVHQYYNYSYILFFEDTTTKKHFAPAGEVVSFIFSMILNLKFVCVLLRLVRENDLFFSAKRKERILTTPRKNGTLLENQVCGLFKGQRAEFHRDKCENLSRQPGPGHLQVGLERYAYIFRILCLKKINPRIRRYSYKRWAGRK